MKRNERLPELKRRPSYPVRSDIPQIGSSRKRRAGFLSSLAFDRKPVIPQMGSGTRASRSRTPRVVVVIALSVIAGLALTFKLWLPEVASLIPDRYVMAYAPEGLQQLIFQIDTSEQVPTPSGGNVDAAGLIAGVVTPTPDPNITPSPTPTLGSGSSTGGHTYLQPTAVPVAPTPTVTPAFTVMVDPNAVDAENSADLSEVQQLLTGFTWEQQGYNNCGPASVKVYMSYWGVEFEEDEAAKFLKPNEEDPNVRPDEIAAFAATKGYETTIRVNGTIEKLKHILLAGYPVLIETGYDPEPETIGWTSHYLTLVGFTNDGFIAMDTYRRPNWLYSFDEIDMYWRQFNRRYIIIHRPDQAVAVASLISEEVNDQVMYENARYTAQLELSLNRNDPFGWYNLGAALTHLGDYEKAVSAFDEARRIGLPWRFLWYQFEAYEAYMQMGMYDEVIALANSVLEKKASEEAYYYKGIAMVAQGDTEGGIRQIDLATSFNRNYEVARLALESLQG